MSTYTDIVDIHPTDHVETLKNCSGYYKCPRDEQGRRIGPLVAYAGKYDAPDGTEKQFVGDIYFNFAKAEERPPVLDYMAKCLADLIQTKIGIPDVILGAPMGGLWLAADVARHLGCRRIFAEKKVIKPADPEHGLKEQSELVITRHDLRPGDTVVLVEDVMNNFSTTDKMVALVGKKGGKVIALSCGLNRSGKTEWNNLPVIALEYRPTEQYKQEDPEVADDIAKGNIVWEAKKQWDEKLAPHMK